MRLCFQLQRRKSFHKLNPMAAVTQIQRGQLAHIPSTSGVSVTAAHECQSSAVAFMVR